MKEKQVPCYIVSMYSIWGETIFKIFFERSHADNYIKNYNPVIAPFMMVKEEKITQLIEEDDVIVTPPPVSTPPSDDPNKIDTLGDVIRQVSDPILNRLMDTE